MRNYLKRIPVLAATGVLAILGFMLRKHQLLHGFTEAGLPNGVGVPGLVILVILAVAAFVAVALTKEKRPGWEENYTKSPLSFGLSLLSAGLLLAASGLIFVSQTPVAEDTNIIATRLTAVLGLLTALCYVVIAAGNYRGKAAKTGAYLLPIIYYILQLIFNFKSWSTDPVILDYCFKLFSLISILLAVFHTGGFVFGSGKRRASIFFCLAGIFFAAPAVADGGVGFVLQTLGSALWLLANAWQLLGEPKKQ